MGIGLGTRITTCTSCGRPVGQPNRQIQVHTLGILDYFAVEQSCTRCLKRQRIFALLALAVFIGGMVAVVTIILLF